MDTWRTAMVVEYDEGFHDKDDQSWHPCVTALRLEGDTLHVHQHGERRTLRVLGAVPGLGVVLLARGERRAVFDLRTRRLYEGSLTTAESISPGRAPDAVDLGGWVARVLRVHEAITDRPVVTTGIAWDPPRPYPLGGPGSTYTRGLVGPDAKAEVLRDPGGAVVSTAVTRDLGARVSARWIAALPDVVEVRGRLTPRELAPFRAAAREELFAGEAPAAWEDDARQLAALP